MFRVLVLDPIPNSVTILHSQDNETGFDGRLWLHFKISSDDFNLVLASNEWKVDPDFARDMDNKITKIEDWWNPQSLGSDVTKYAMLIKSDGDRKRIEYIWVNSQRTEVYLLYQDDFTH